MTIKDQLLALINPLLLIVIGAILSNIIPGFTLSEFLIINIVMNLHLIGKEIRYKSNTESTSQNQEK